MCSFKAMKVNHKEIKKYQNPEEEYSTYVDKFSDRRLLARLINGRKVKPCGRECHEHGFLIAEGWHHSSFENFPELMNDEEFILAAAERTPNPVDCGNYFYLYVNHHLRRKSEFRLKFLKQVYLNLNVNRLEDINLIVESLDLQNENKMILNDLEFKKLIEQKFNKILKKMDLEYHCSGIDKKELRKYKIKVNDLKIMLENIKKGLTDIINSFNVGEKIDEPIFEPNSFYEYLNSQTTKTAQENKPKQIEEKPQTKKQEENEDYEPTTFYEYMCNQHKKKSNHTNNGRTF